MNDVWEAIATAISEVTGEPFTLQRTESVSGGCINDTVIAHGGQTKFFVKLNSAARLSMFEAEAAGLDEIIASQSIRAPQPLAWGAATGRAWLVLECLDLGGQRSHGAMAKLGEQLAVMHRTTQSCFGWYRDNTIGATPQINAYCDNWVEFWCQQRLQYQLVLAARHGYRGRLQQRGETLLVDACPALLHEHTPAASLLHGDLWSGNYVVCSDGMPAILDPAVYYGDRETDLAMTELFGGFGSDFYRAYHDTWPLDPGYEVRKTLYNLYHILNHLNLFGGGYASQAEHMIDSILAQVR